ncbi:MAG: hypothetical protein JHC26_08660 [Thermofilum sp.]|jgi:hypothetical protein|uniref:hypothetical protein n=1 Tax=Thermofilum sp. TaxID=1961369 RepID=UPI00258BD7EC|nr:hypothetical protein [Thermofilum sp.]MCI4409148.1 hypothetical protein [Thermofilum sp.]
MWWLYGALGIAAVIYAILSPMQRRLAIAAGLFLFTILVHVISTSYLGMLYASAQKDSSGNIVWTLDLSDRVRDTMSIMYVNIVLLVSAIFLILWSAYSYGTREVSRWARW